MAGRRATSAKRYAQAVFQIAEEKGQADRWLEDLARMSEGLRNEELVTFLNSPSVRMEHKVGVIEEAFPEVGPLARNLLALLASRRAVELVAQVAEGYQALVDARRGILRAELVTAVEVDGDLTRRAAEGLSRFLGGEVRVIQRVDPSILGGLMVRVGDRVIDGSTRGRLEALKKELREAAF
ncbi:MAG: F0F1 ATP synthase subunit delta [Chloroflexi bacterium]|nr:F0F1 ATP synthase subunit delta [Chloroflexota bacterium]